MCYLILLQRCKLLALQNRALPFLHCILLLHPRFPCSGPLSPCCLYFPSTWNIFLPEIAGVSTLFNLDSAPKIFSSGWVSSLLKACIYWMFLRFSRVKATFNCLFAGFFLALLIILWVCCLASCLVPGPLSFWESESKTRFWVPWLAGSIIPVLDPDAITGLGYLCPSTFQGHVDTCFIEDNTWFWGFFLGGGLVFLAIRYSLCAYFIHSLSYILFLWGHLGKLTFKKHCIIVMSLPSEIPGDHLKV